MRRQPFGRRLARFVWPKLLAIGIVLAIWEAVVLAGIWPEYLLPGPATVLAELASGFADGTLPLAIAVTLRRAIIGYLLAAVIGILVGLAVSRSRLLRDAVGSLITGLQTMPSIAWFPLAILLFQLSETAILFVVVLGRGALDRQRRDRRDRPRAAAAAPGRPGPRGSGRRRPTATSSCRPPCRPSWPVSSKAGPSPGAA